MILWFCDSLENNFISSHDDPIVMIRLCVTVIGLYFCPVLFVETVSQHTLCLNYLLSPLILGYKKLCIVRMNNNINTNNMLFWISNWFCMHNFIHFFNNCIQNIFLLLKSVWFKGFIWYMHVPSDDTFLCSCPFKECFFFFSETFLLILFWLTTLFLVCLVISNFSF